MSKPAGKCVFCGGRGLTHGHVWPDWFGDILPETATEHEHETGRFYTFIPTIPGPAYSRRVKPGHARSRKPRNTCARCNSGWMSNVESLAKNPTLPIIAGVPSVLDTFGQRLLAALLCLISMRMEFLGVMRAVSPQDRDWLRYYREPSDDWKIWIARLADEHADSWARFYAAQLGPLPADKIGPEHCNVQVATMVIGKLCAHTFYSPDIDLSSYGYEGVRLTCIWPPGRFDIQTAHLPAFTNKTILWLHEAFARESRKPPTEPNQSAPPPLGGESHT
jgi:hypothetical protein